MKDKTIMIRYGYFDALFLLPRHPYVVLVSLELAWKMMVIEKWFDYRGNFKIIHPLSSAIRSVTLLEVDYDDDL